jgi:hypothetical protein
LELRTSLHILAIQMDDISSSSTLAIQASSYLYGELPSFQMDAQNEFENNQNDLQNGMLVILFFLLFSFKY